MEWEEANVSQTEMSQEGLMACLVFSTSLVGCWQGAVEVRGTLLPQNKGELDVPRVPLR